MELITGLLAKMPWEMVMVTGFIVLFAQTHRLEKRIAEKLDNGLTSQVAELLATCKERGQHCPGLSGKG